MSAKGFGQGQVAGCKHWLVGIHMAVPWVAMEKPWLALDWQFLLFARDSLVQAQVENS